MKRFHVCLRRRQDRDLISFFRQQDYSAYSLLALALYSYIKQIPLDISLNPVTVTEQEKDLDVGFFFSSKKKGSVSKIIDVDAIAHYLEQIPKGMGNQFVKGILRCVYGNVIYRLGMDEVPKIIFQQEILPPVTPPAKLQPENEPESMPKQEDTEVSKLSDDVFDLLESLLG